ncbi:MAG: hypothetical protein MHPSP_000644, partial [Paramarteilia canceri]
ANNEILIGKAIDQTINQSYFAIKLFNIQSSNSKIVNLYEKELEFLKKADKCENIVTLYSYSDSLIFNNCKYAYLMMEYCSKGSLVEILTNRKLRLNFNQSAIVAYHIGNAIDYCHKDMKIVHRDIKIDNIIINSIGVAKLCDFGSATFFQSFDLKIINQADKSKIQTNFFQTTTAIYRAPEIIDIFTAEKLNQKLDIWAFGCVLYCLVFNFHPFYNKSVSAILNANYSMKPDDFNKIFPNEIFKIIIDCLNVNQNDRLDSKDLKIRLKTLIENFKCHKSELKALPNKEIIPLNNNKQAKNSNFGKYFQNTTQKAKHFFENIKIDSKTTNEMSESRAVDIKFSQIKLTENIVVYAPNDDMILSMKNNNMACNFDADSLEDPSNTLILDFSSKKINLLNYSSMNTLKCNFKTLPDSNKLALIFYKSILKLMKLYNKVSIFCMKNKMGMMIGLELISSMGIEFDFKNAFQHFIRHENNEYNPIYEMHSICLRYSFSRDLFVPRTSVKIKAIELIPNKFFNSQNVSITLTDLRKNKVYKSLIPTSILQRSRSKLFFPCQFDFFGDSLIKVFSESGHFIDLFFSTDVNITNDSNGQSFTALEFYSNLPEKKETTLQLLWKTKIETSPLDKKILTKSDKQFFVDRFTNKSDCQLFESFRPGSKAKNDAKIKTSNSGQEENIKIDLNNLNSEDEDILINFDNSEMEDKNEELTHSGYEETTTKSSDSKDNYSIFNDDSVYVKDIFNENSNNNQYSTASGEFQTNNKPKKSEENNSFKTNNNEYNDTFKFTDYDDFDNLFTDTLSFNNYDDGKFTNKEPPQPNISDDASKGGQKNKTKTNSSSDGKKIEEDSGAEDLKNFKEKLQKWKKIYGNDKVSMLNNLDKLLWADIREKWKKTIDQNGRINFGNLSKYTRTARRFFHPDTYSDPIEKKKVEEIFTLFS